MSLAVLETERLLIREYISDDLETHHRLMAEAFDSTASVEDARAWMTWTVANYQQLAALHQPPYGDYAIALKANGEVIGSVGLVPAVIPWGVLPEFRAESGENMFTLPEFGLFWAVFKTHRGNGYAVEAAQGVINFAFNDMNARRIVATTEFDNANSQRVMEKLGMKLYRNPGSDPFWFQVVGVLNHPDWKGVSV
jgi:[ribosomal protein S5]-alanine N-acetyltransferase